MRKPLRLLDAHRLRILLPAALLTLLAVFILPRCAENRAWLADKAWWFDDSPDLSDKEYELVDVVSHHIPMRDGVRIAADIYLPKNRKTDARYPTILVQTRYVRAMQYKFPFSLFLHGRFDKMIRKFVRHGYVWVYVDARGSGASGGTRQYPYSEEETKDGDDIVNWIIAQPWSDGTVGAWGNSYTGGSAIMLATNNHPAVKAIMPRYAMFDVYSEVVFPGGVKLTWLTDTWSRLAAALDANRVSEFVGKQADIAVTGTKPVDNDPKRQQLEAAVREHASNGNIAKLTETLVYRDDEPPQIPGLTIDTISPHAHLDQLNSAKTAWYFYTGWFDASFVLSEIHLFMNVEDPHSKLTIGPWDHGGYTMISPWTKRLKPQFDTGAETMRFFDRYLKGAENGIDDEARVHYYTMGEERWKSADTWPPPGLKDLPLYLAADGKLSKSLPESNGTDSYLVDQDVGTGKLTRWTSLVNLEHKPIHYADRREIDKRLLTYTTPPLEDDVEVTGHPIVHLNLASTATDGAVMVYLSDVHPDGQVTYVTEGLLRAIHRKVSPEKAPYKTPVPYHSYLKADASPLTPGEPAEFVFDLYPTSYLFMEGHAIRIAISGADKDHFDPIPKEPPTLTMHRGPSMPSHINLPVMPH